MSAPARPRTLDTTGSCSVVVSENARVSELLLGSSSGCPVRAAASSPGTLSLSIRTGPIGQAILPECAEAKRKSEGGTGSGCWDVTLLCCACRGRRCRMPKG